MDHTKCKDCKHKGKDFIEEPCASCNVHWDDSEKFKCNYEKEEK